ncbi:hypothetical protein, partial [Actinomadura sp. KC06]|uniref:hypothetical protein n=1 Tax=Actinomadura sp. KC06 TaxID=2530369 RepID=UPI001A9D6D32
MSETMNSCVHVQSAGRWGCDAQVGASRNSCSWSLRSGNSPAAYTDPHSIPSPISSTGIATNRQDSRDRLRTSSDPPSMTGSS